MCPATCCQEPQQERWAGLIYLFINPAELLLWVFTGFRAGWCNAFWQRAPWSWVTSGFMWWEKRFERPVIHVHRWSFSVWIAKLGSPLRKQGSVCWQAVGQIKPDIQSQASCPGLESPAHVFPGDFKTGPQLQGLIGAKLCECVVSMSAAPQPQTEIIPCFCWAFLGSLWAQQFFCGALITGYCRVGLGIFLPGTAELQMGL